MIHRYDQDATIYSRSMNHQLRKF